MGRVVSLLILAMAGMTGIVAPASATLPGRNGGLVMLSVDGGRDGYGATVMRVGRRGEPIRRRFVCGYRWVPSGPFAPGCTDIDGLVPSPGSGGVTFTARTFDRTADGRHAYSAWIADLAFGGGEQWRRPLEVHAPDGGRYEYSSLSWSPRGDRLLVTRRLDEPLRPDSFERDELVLIDAQGTAHSAVGEPDAREPDWSARGEIAFVAGGDPPLFPGDLYRARLGDPARRLTRRGAADPSWSPGGTKIAFVRRCPDLTPLITNDPCVYVMSSHGGKPRLLARQAAEPAWSPDGKRIAFLRRYLPPGGDPVGTGRALFTVDIATGRARRLTDALDNIDAGYGVSDLAWLPKR